MSKGFDVYLVNSGDAYELSSFLIIAELLSLMLCISLIGYTLLETILLPIPLFSFIILLNTKSSYFPFKNNAINPKVFPKINQKAIYL